MLSSQLSVCLSVNLSISQKLPENLFLTWHERCLCCVQSMRMLQKSMSWFFKNCFNILLLCSVEIIHEKISNLVLCDFDFRIDMVYSNA